VFYDTEGIVACPQDVLQGSRIVAWPSTVDPLNVLYFSALPLSTQSYEANLYYVVFGSGGQSECSLVRPGFVVVTNSVRLNTNPRDEYAKLMKYEK
jgi:hypothetical protein